MAPPDADEDQPPPSPPTSTLYSNPSPERTQDDMSNNTITDNDQLPGLMCRMDRWFNGFTTQVWVDTDLPSNDLALFGGAIDINTGVRRSIFTIVNPVEQWSYIDNVMVSRQPDAGPRFRQTSRLFISEQPDVVMLPNNGEVYTAQKLLVRNANRTDVCWLRDNIRDNLLWTTGHHCLLSGDEIPCGCQICNDTEEHDGVQISYVDGYYFARCVLSTYPYDYAITPTPLDRRRVEIYNMVEENIRNRQQNPTQSQQEVSDDEPTIYHVNMTSEVLFGNNTKHIIHPTHNANEIPPKRTDGKPSMKRSRPRSNSDPSVPKPTPKPTRPSTPPGHGRPIIDLKNKVDPFARCHHLRGRTSRRKLKQKLRIILSDGGSSKSLFSNRRLFTNYTEVRNSFVKMADGTMCKVLGMGDVGKLRDVLHVEGLVFDLVSESWCDLQGMFGTWEKGVRTVYDTDGSIFYVSYLEDGLYIVNPLLLGIDDPEYVDEVDVCLASKAESCNKIHETLAHINGKRITKGIASGHIPWMHESNPSSLRKCSDKCVICQLSKSTRRSFTSPLRTPLAPGQHVYLDLFGPVDTPSLINGNTYVAGFIDGYSSHL